MCLFLGVKVGDPNFVLKKFGSPILWTFWDQCGSEDLGSASWYGPLGFDMPINVLQDFVIYFLISHNTHDFFSY